MPKKIKRNKTKSRRILVRVPRGIPVVLRQPIGDIITPIRHKQKPIRNKRSAANDSDVSVVSGAVPQTTSEVREFDPIPQVDQAKSLLQEDPDYINSKRFDFSLQKLLERYPSGCSERIAANALMLTEEEFKEAHEKIVAKLRFFMNVTADD